MFCLMTFYEEIHCQGIEKVKFLKKRTNGLIFDSSVGKWMILRMMILLEYFDKHFSRYDSQATSCT